MSSEPPIIQPYPPVDRREGTDWECQCARCGSSADWVDCGECEDGYVEEDLGDDVVPEIHDVMCSFCFGHGGWYWCLSSREWCRDNPLEGREDIKRGQIEWYEV